VSILKIIACYVELVTGFCSSAEDVYCYNIFPTMKSNNYFTI